MVPKVTELVEGVRPDGLECLRALFRSLNGTIGYDFED